jgi:hypothetical protein
MRDINIKEMSRFQKSCGMAKQEGRDSGKKGREGSDRAPMLPMVRRE